jgi:hypothetical protein
MDTLRSQTVYQRTSYPRREAIDLEDSANSYHDWIERITAGYYPPNGAAHALEANKRIR